MEKYPELKSGQIDLQKVGEALLKARKALKISSTSLAEMAQISRVTLHRIEKGSSSVAMGSYLAVLNALGLTIKIASLQAENEDASLLKIPSSIELRKYPGLKSLAWQVAGVDSLTPKEAYDLYERNHRHLDQKALSQDEFDLINALRLVFGE